MSINQEKTRHKSQEKIQIHDLSEEQLEKYRKLDNKHDNIEQNNSSIIEKNLSEVREIAVQSEKNNYEKQSQGNPRIAHQIINKRLLNKSYSKTLKDTQSELNTASRVFSKFIHKKAIESLSNVTGSTLARPNAILFGAITSFASTLFIYIIAKKIGYTLSGFEPIISFAIGWTLGIIYDYFKLIITGKK